MNQSKKTPDPARRLVSPEPAGTPLDNLLTAKMSPRTLIAASNFLSQALLVSQSPSSGLLTRYARKRIPKPKLLACVFFREFLGIGWRPTLRLLKSHSELRHAIHLEFVPTHPTLLRIKSRFTPQDIVRLINEILHRIPEGDRTVLAKLRQKTESPACLHYIVRHIDGKYAFNRIRKGMLRRERVLAHDDYFSGIPLVMLSNSTLKNLPTNPPNR